MYYTIYKITHNATGRYYIGAHKTSDLNDDYMGSGVHISRAIKKYGKDAFTKEILSLHDSEESMYAEEARIVEVNENTYNKTLGGKGGFSHIDTSGDNNSMRKSAETRQRVSDALKLKRKENKEHYDAISKKNLEKAIEANIGRKRPEHSQFMSAFAKTIWENNKEKMRDALSDTYEITSPLGEVFVTNRLTDFCKQYNLAFTTMCVNSSTGRIPIKGRNKGWKCIIKE